jgi:ABC-2 type transport system permease protein
MTTRADMANIATIARREYSVRVRTRSFVLGTVLIVIGVVVIAFLPVITRQLDRVNATKIGIVATEPGLAVTAAASVGALLNAPTGSTIPDPATQPDFVVTAAPGDLAAGRRAVGDGTYGALLALERDPAGELSFTLYTDEPSTGRTASLIRQAATALAVGDRLDRLGVQPADRAGLFKPAAFTVTWPDPAKTGPTRDTVATMGQDMLAFGMTILIFMIVIMYGNWIAMSVVEEKSSRVMEVILNAATPLQLLSGKVFGVGAVAFTQYAAVVLAGGTALLLQNPVAELVLGSPGAGADLPQGLTPELLLAFGVYGILGFLLYATLFAAAGSLVSRQEDVSAAVMPLTMLCTAGYMIGVYAAMGLIDIEAGWILGLTLVPFLAPFMMLGRIAVGAAAPWEIAASLALLVAVLGVALWVAARIYAVGVLLYGSRPGARAVWRLLREGM